VQLLRASGKHTGEAIDLSVIMAGSSFGDGGVVFGSVLTRHLCADADVGFVIKWNPRRQDLVAWRERAEKEAAWTSPREGKRVGTFSQTIEEEFRGRTRTFRRVVRVTVRDIDRHGNNLLVPDIALEGWWTSLPEALVDEDQVIGLYRAHGTSEQFHSEFKTDLDIERLPSGKFATNDLVLACAVDLQHPALDRHRRADGAVGAGAARGQAATAAYGDAGADVSGRARRRERATGGAQVLGALPGLPELRSSLRPALSVLTPPPGG
jgi:hypothetical protein